MMADVPEEHADDTGGPQSPGADVADPAEAASPPDARRRTGAEIAIVLGLSLGSSAVYAVIDLVGKLTAGPPLAQQTATLNRSVSPRPYLDLSYQLAGIAFTLVPVALVLFLLADRRNEHPDGSAPAGGSAARRIGLDLRRPGRDTVAGLALAALIGLPGLGLYVVGRKLGITVDVVASGLAPYWWTVPVLVLQAVKNAMVEEVVVVGYLLTRLRGLGLPDRAGIVISALLRGSYHLYQGFGPFLGNAVMGLVFGEWFRRRGRVMPLVIAHTLLDVVAFVGYQLLGHALGLR